NASLPSRRRKTRTQGGTSWRSGSTITRGLTSRVRRSPRSTTAPPAASTFWTHSAPGPYVSAIVTPPERRNTATRVRYARPQRRPRGAPRPPRAPPPVHDQPPARHARHERPRDRVRNLSIEARQPARKRH